MASSTRPQWLVLVVLVALVVSSVHGQIESPFDGQWTANWGYGGTQYLCGSTVNGVFSGVWSQAGVVVGKLNGNVATGNWYEAGTGPCYTGTFNWTLSADGNTITGTVKCSDGTGLTNVIETRIDAVHPESAQCARLGSLSAAGEWTLETNEFDVWDVCVGSFVSSYSFPTTDYAGDAQGYTWGNDYEKSRVISGRWVEANGALGVSIGYVTDDNELVNLVWPTKHINAHLSPTTSQVIVYTFVRHGSPIDCGRNGNLRRPYPYGAASRLANPANQLLVLVLSATMSLLLALFVLY